MFGSVFVTGHRGNAHNKLGDDGKAIEDFEAALKLAPDAPWSADVKAVLEELRGRK